MLKMCPFLDRGLNHRDDNISRTSEFGKLPVYCCSEDLPEEYPSLLIRYISAPQVATELRSIFSEKIINLYNEYMSGNFM